MSLKLESLGNAEIIGLPPKLRGKSGKAAGYWKLGEGVIEPDPDLVFVGVANTEDIFRTRALAGLQSREEGGRVNWEVLKPGEVKILGTEEKGIKVTAI